VGLELRGCCTPSWATELANAKHKGVPLEIGPAKQGLVVLEY
jgi:hypothetical protein